MEVLDENGRVFGVVNVIDLLALLLVGAVVAAGAALVFGAGPAGSSDEAETVTLTVRSEGVQPYVADALSTGRVEGGTVLGIENKSVTPAAVYTENESGAVLTREHPRLKTVELEVVVEVTDGQNGLTFRERPLRVGQSVSIDSGEVLLRGNVTGIETSE